MLDKKNDKSSSLSFSSKKEKTFFKSWFLLLKILIDNLLIIL